MVAGDKQYAVETFSLTKVFADWWGRGKVLAVDELDLQVRYNEVFGLLGPNGSGKTTTLKMLLWLLHPTKGRARLLGGDGRDPKISARIGFLPEESYLYKYLTARETLEFYGRLFGLGGRVRRRRSEALLEMVGLQAAANRAVGTFSKGMARRIGLAQALVNDPDLLILDEPTTGLDPIGTRQIKDLIVELAKRGKTVLLCSHLLADVEDVCDRIAILYGGRMQTQGRVAELLRQSDKRQIVTSRLSDKAIEKIKDVVESESLGQSAAADRAQGPPPAVEITSPMEKLETFFIKIVQQAQSAGRQTSGALSTTRIGDFLTQKTPPQTILDKLVEGHSADTSAVPGPKDKSFSQSPPTGRGGPQPAVGGKDELLEKLTQTPLSIENPESPVRGPVENIENREQEGDVQNA